MDGVGKIVNGRGGACVGFVVRCGGQRAPSPSRPLAEDLIGPFVAFESLAVSRQTAGR